MSGSRDTAGNDPRPRSAWLGSVAAGTRNLIARVRPGRRTASASELLDALQDVASAVSSTLSVEEVLETVVSRAKLLSGTDKAVLMLTSEQSETLDAETLTVRGRRDTHAQEWWIERVRELAPAVMHGSGVHLEEVPDRNAWLLCTALKIKDRPIGVLCAINDARAPFTDQEIEAVRIVSAFAAAAVENARLAEEHRYVLLSSERDRIAREMHDGIAQSLFSISLGLEVCRKTLYRDPAVVAQRLEGLQDELNASMGELRRVIYDLRPAKLAEHGLAASIEHWITEATTGREVKGALVVRGESRYLQGATEACLYRVAKEAVSNVVRHADAASFEVCLDYRSRAVVLYVGDDGNGFDVESTRAAAEERGSMGLHSIQHRVRAEGGTFSVKSVIGQGTEVRVEIPL